MTSNNAGANYQWLDCNNNNAIILSENGQSYTPISNGNYAVQLTENGCIDTSDCILINTIGIIENNFESRVSLYPNPTNGLFSIDLGEIFDVAIISINDIHGKLIDSKSITSAQIIDLSIDQPAGIYLVSITAGDKKAVIRLMKK